MDFIFLITIYGHTVCWALYFPYSIPREVCGNHKVTKVVSDEAYLMVK